MSMWCILINWSSEIDINIPFFIEAFLISFPNLFCLFRVIKESLLSPSRHRLGTVPYFHPHVTRDLHALAQLACQSKSHVYTCISINIYSVFLLWFNIYHMEPDVIAELGSNWISYWLTRVKEGKWDATWCGMLVWWEYIF